MSSLNGIIKKATSTIGLLKQKDMGNAVGELVSLNKMFLMDVFSIFFVFFFLYFQVKITPQPPSQPPSQPSPKDKLTLKKRTKEVFKGLGQLIFSAIVSFFFISTFSYLILRVGSVYGLSKIEELYENHQEREIITPLLDVGFDIDIIRKILKNVHMDSLAHFRDFVLGKMIQLNKVGIPTINLNKAKHIFENLIENQFDTLYKQTIHLIESKETKDAIDAIQPITQLATSSIVTEGVKWVKDLMSAPVLYVTKYVSSRSGDMPVTMIQMKNYVKITQLNRAKQGFMEFYSLYLNEYINWYDRYFQIVFSLNVPILTLTELPRMKKALKKILDAFKNEQDKIIKKQTKLLEYQELPSPKIKQTRTATPKSEYVDLPLVPFSRKREGDLLTLPLRVHSPPTVRFPLEKTPSSRVTCTTPVLEVTEVTIAPVVSKKNKAKRRKTLKVSHREDKKLPFLTRGLFSKYRHRIREKERAKIATLASLKSASKSIHPPSLSKKSSSVKQTTEPRQTGTKRKGSDLSPPTTSPKKTKRRQSRKQKLD